MKILPTEIKKLKVDPSETENLFEPRNPSEQKSRIESRNRTEIRNRSEQRSLMVNRDPTEIRNHLGIENHFETRSHLERSRMEIRNRIEIRNHLAIRNRMGIPLGNLLRKIGLLVQRKHMVTRDHPEKEKRLVILDHLRDKSDSFLIQKNNPLIRNTLHWIVF
jgi:hypothetical protein